MYDAVRCIQYAICHIPFDVYIVQHTVNKIRYVKVFLNFFGFSVMVNKVIIMLFDSDSPLISGQFESSQVNAL